MIEFLKKLTQIDELNQEYAFDNLTKVLSRQVIVEIAQKLIKDGTPFTFMILDIDNFKQINDSYGHLIGDNILTDVTTNFRKIIDKKAFIGRFGGDEFLILLPNVTDYDEVHLFLEEVYSKDKIFRKYYNVGPRDVYLTATLGCASFPNDATEYKELFNKADKALYRGKIKGRNCYIIYVESKHGHIVVEDGFNNSLVEKFKSVRRIFDIYKTREEKVKNLIDFLYSEFHVSECYFLFPNAKYFCNYFPTLKTTGLDFIPHFELLLNGDIIFYDTPLKKYKEKDLSLDKYVNDNNIHSVIISKVKLGNYQYGYIVLTEKTISRVWQENEVSVVMYAASLLESEFKNYDKE